MKTRILPKGRAAKVAIAFAALVVVAAAGTFFAYSAVAAVACPACYRFDRLAPEVFVDRAMPTEDRNRVMDILSEARERVGAFYGGFTSNPRILICSTETCYRDIGGHRERGRSFFDFALMLSPRGLNVTIASHELSHVELHHRLGLLRSMNNSIPSWFKTTRYDVRGASKACVRDTDYAPSERRGVGSTDRRIADFFSRRSASVLKSAAANGWHQFISASGSSWATMALFTLPEREIRELTAAQLRSG